MWDPMKEVQELAGTVQSKDEDQLQLLESIGTGGFGTVYRGRWRNLDVAVKTVLFTSKQGGGDSPEKQIIKEAAVCSTVIHPNVVRVRAWACLPLQCPTPLAASALYQPGHRQQRPLSHAFLRRASVTGSQLASHQPISPYLPKTRSPVTVVSHCASPCALMTRLHNHRAP